MCRLTPAFFGLQPSDREGLVLEPCFLLMYYLGFSYQDYWSLPVADKHWFFERLRKEIEPKEGQEHAPPNRGIESNSPEIRGLMGRNREQVPARLRRFT